MARRRAAAHEGPGDLPRPGGGHLDPPFFLGDAAANPSDEIEYPHDFLRALCSFLSRRTGDAILMGEVNLPFEKQRLYFGDDGECDGSESGPSSSELTL
ncbi:hypothetical protein H1Q78_13650 [Cellulosimicrobium cellulans]|uniref:hypothetical protein n=1 Tax=Cellulosimicrobium cellulans TaxID=1710 RepID=UPI002ED6F3C5|nr:hypothetical protein H1Q78_13650 [Cellulosimicrobium cellulans]